MELYTSYIIGAIILVAFCTWFGLWLSNRKHDESVDYTIECQCGSVDFTEKETFYICKDCATKIIK